MARSLSLALCIQDHPWNITHSQEILIDRVNGLYGLLYNPGQPGLWLL